MKANELKITDLMVGDWVMSFGAPHKVVCIRTDMFEPYIMTDMSDTWYEEGIENLLEPIQLTPEILEKNGFDVVRGNRIMGLQVSDRCILRIGDGMKEKRVEMQNWGETEERKWFIEIRNLGSIILQLYIGYTHQLQHALRLCGINKEIEL